MSHQMVYPITTHFAQVEDLRIERTKDHALLDMIIIALCAVICGADSWVDIETFGKAKLIWFRTFLPLPNGICVLFPVFHGKELRQNPDTQRTRVLVSCPPPAAAPAPCPASLDPSPFFPCFCEHFHGIPRFFSF